jgi:hypothetical protein
MKRLNIFVKQLIIVPFILYSLQSCIEPNHNKITYIVKVKDEIEFTSTANEKNTINKVKKDAQMENFNEKIIDFSIKYFKTKEDLGFLLLNEPYKLSPYEGDVIFINDLLKLKDESWFSFINVNEQSNAINSISPLLTNFDDMSAVIKASSKNNQLGKYLCTNLFNYIAIEFEEHNEKSVEKILNQYLYKVDSTHNFMSNLKGNRIVEYFYKMSDVGVSNSISATSGTPIDFKTTMSFPSSTILGDGSNVGIIEFDENVYLDSRKPWRYTVPSTAFDISYPDHGTQVMGVLFGGEVGVTGIVPNAQARIVSYRPAFNAKINQYSQFIKALAQSIDSIGRIKSKVILIEVHNVVGVVGGSQKLPLESDPTMFFFIRLGAFGMNRIITEVAGNGGHNLDMIDSVYLDVKGVPLGEYNSAIGNVPLRTRLQITTLLINNTNATPSEIVMNMGYVTNTITSTNSWLSTWKIRPSGAIMIAGYDGSTCTTNYGTKIKIIGPASNVPSYSWTGSSYSSTIFNGSSSASAVVTGVIASALSENALLSEGTIKKALYTPSATTVTRTDGIKYTMYVPNVQKFYQCLRLSSPYIVCP